MKTINRITVLLIILPFSLNLRAQDHENSSLFSQGSRVTGWYLGATSSCTRLNGLYTSMPGVEAGLVMNNDFRIGFAGKSFSSYETQLLFDDVLDEKCYLNGGYGGLLLEASTGDDRLIHLNIPVLMGVGGVTYLSATRYPEPDDDGETDFMRRSLSASPFLIFEPGMEAEVNLTCFLRVYAGYSYRWLKGLSLDNTSQTAMDGGSFNAGIRIGKL